MAQKRMFSLQVIDTDRFMDMSTSAQALYFHLGMHGDDDGFVASPRKLVRAAGCNDDDLRLLAAKGYIIPFDSGVIVVTDWNINNTLKNDRYHETVYVEEKAKLSVDKSGRYILGTDLEPKCFQVGANVEPEHNITQLNITQQDIEGADKPPRAPRPTPADWGFGPELTDAFEDWLRYKREKRQGYKPTGLNSLIQQVKSNTAKFGEAAVVDLIRRCMAANWQGIIWEKLDKPQAADRSRLRTEADYGDDDFFKR